MMRMLFYFFCWSISEMIIESKNTDRVTVRMNFFGKDSMIPFVKGRFIR